MKGIIFRPNLIKAIAEDDREWQTRRLGGLKEINKEPDKWILYDFHSAHGVVTHTNKPNSKGQFIFWQAPIFDSPDGSYKYIKPRYQVGETVYIKEATCIECYGRDGIEDACYKTDEDGGEAIEIDCDSAKWNSPMFMFAWAARYFIKITDIRVERLQEITEIDVEREGTPMVEPRPSGVSKDDYRVLWNSINAKWKRVYNKKLKIYEFWQFPWSEADAVPIPKTKHPERYHCIPNPFVFVYSFKKAEK